MANNSYGEIQMYEMKITIDKEKIKEDGIYNVEDIEGAIDALIEKRDIEHISSSWYRGNMTTLGSLMLTLSKHEWFTDYATDWILWDIDNGGSEDLLKSYTGRASQVRVKRA